ncbi:MULTISPECIES: hypothetical protein [Staphylococcus]|uniref:Uncharacterized protein n=2 Tax=Staphylococcus TaxID=1279 RepID=A0ABX3Z3G9_9STAP|nr:MULTISPECIES: hypothetical protein [Staphylococcus]MDG4944001.1 hypothetical protein [Staphylococcus agnetis]MDP4462672.1 hypothetical protein [Staphylococcus hyicus]MDP4468737.1 hypothetical protein [Staphylococcus hyicus]OSP22651.1 hypothetical protein B9L42_00805 [Staphylococcus agnetis]OSP23058.1 hypothetical protein B9M87_08990 [Staphylococcus agnetis]
MDSKNIILKDAFYSNSKSSLTLKPLRNTTDDEEKIIYYEVIIEFENQKFKSELAIFEEDIENLKNFEYTFPMTDFYFIEPDITFTILDYESEYLSLYVNLDSGLRYSNECTESGLSVRLNVTKEDIDRFMNKIITIDNI